MRVSVFTLTLTLIPSWISPAIVRSVSLRPQNEGQKNSRIAPMHTESLTRIFLTFVSDANRFQTDLQALPLAAAEIKIIQHLILGKASAANLQDSSDSCDSCSKKTFAYIKLNANLSNESFNMQTNPKNESVYNPSCPVKAQSRSKENQKKNQKNGSVKRLRCIRAIRERFLILRGCVKTTHPLFLIG